MLMRSVKSEMRRPVTRVETFAVMLCRDRELVDLAMVRRTCALRS